MERTISNLLVVNEFKGVHQLLDEVKMLPALVPWMFGMMTDETSSLRRLPGKVLATTGHNAAVLSITQLTFDGIQKTVVHCGTRILYANEDLTHLRTPFSGNFPGTPFIPLNGGSSRKVHP
jgi:hypothetical protein